MDLQRAFLRFHRSIKQDDNATLREKRERVLTRLQGSTPYRFRVFNQGGYKLGTGVKPVGDREYDIDVGLVLDIHVDDFSPIVVKDWVFRAVQPHTKRVQFRRPVVTVHYVGTPNPFHVDLAIYGEDDDGDRYLAVGRRNSQDSEVYWQRSSPQALTDEIRSAFEDAEDWKQFQRVVRYLKRWKHHQFPAAGNAAPPGIGLTLAAYHWFEPADEDYDALVELVDAMRGQFSGFFRRRLSVEVPVAPHDDPFERMSDRQMERFESKLETLSARLDRAERSTRTATRSLRAAFGPDFPEVR